MPVTRYQGWRNQQLMGAYYRERDTILQNYATIKKAVITSYTEVARNAYRILNKLDPDILIERGKSAVTQPGVRVPRRADFTWTGPAGLGRHPPGALG